MTPRNILTDDISEEEVFAALRSHPPWLPVFGASEWRQAAGNPQAQSLFAPILAQAEKERETPLPTLTDDLYADYHRTGSRTAFSEAYFRRRRMLSRAALCALFAGEGEREKWLSVLVRHLRDVLREESWALTAHVASPTGKDPLNIDLFAAETANTLGELLAVFQAVLPEDLSFEVRGRLRADIFQNYLDNHASLGWASSTHNWNAVCHQGILGAALAAEQDMRIVARLLLVVKQYLPRFLDGFGADGGCSEGPGYWGYGFGCFTFLNEQLESASQGALSLMEGDEHVHQIALFYPRTALSNGYMVNFADSPSRGRPNPHLLSYLGERLEDALLRAYGSDAWRTLFQNGFALESERCDFFYLAPILRDCPTPWPEAAPPPRSDFYFHDLHVLVAHRQDAQGNVWEFAVKGGYNAEHHNHNDCGSYLLHINGCPCVMEIGAPEYHKAYFGPDRYETFAARTSGHSLPIVNGYEQSAGPGFAATVLAHDLVPEGVRFVVDLTRCYPAEAACRSLIRTVEFSAATGRFAVTDEYALSDVRSLETAVIVGQEIQFVEDGLLIMSGEKNVRLCPAPGAYIGATERHVVRLHPSGTSVVQRIVLLPRALAAHGTVGYHFVPAHAMTAVP